MSSPSHRISIYFSYILRPPLEGRALHSQECFLPPRRGFNLRCTRERDIPKNVFFLREEVLIYDAPMHPVYHAKITVSTKNFPRSQVNLRHDSSRARRAVGRACSASAARRALARSGRFVPAVYICFGTYYESPFLHTIEAHS